MSDQGDNNFITHIYRGVEGEFIPRWATHITVAEGVTVIRADAFYEHPNIIEIICHEDVETIEHCAFYECPRLQRVIMPGVKLVCESAFYWCDALTDVECDKLEIIKGCSFEWCQSLRNINLSSIRIVPERAFYGCGGMIEANFSDKLERFDVSAFGACFSLERITIPLKDGLIGDDDIFMACEDLVRVDLVEGELHKTIAALHLEDWRNDMNEEIDSINQILPNTYSGYYDDKWFNHDEGEKAQTIRSWIRSVLRRIAHYRAEHERLLIEAAETLQFILPQDIAMNNIVPFFELPVQTFEGEIEADGNDE